MEQGERLVTGGSANPVDFLELAGRKMAKVLDALHLLDGQERGIQRVVFQKRSIAAGLPAVAIASGEARVDFKQAAVPPCGPFEKEVEPPPPQAVDDLRRGPPRTANGHGYKSTANGGLREAFHGDGIFTWPCGGHIAVLPPARRWAFQIENINAPTTARAVDFFRSSRRW